MNVEIIKVLVLYMLFMFTLEVWTSHVITPNTSRDERSMWWYIVYVTFPLTSFGLLCVLFYIGDN